MNLFNTKTNYARLKLVAQGKTKAKKYDFEMQPESPSLIHLAAYHNNLELFKECILKGQSASLLDAGKYSPLQYAFKGHSYQILDYLKNEYQMNLADQKGAYSEPLWWTAFTTSGISVSGKVDFINFDKDDYQAMAKYLQNSGVDFNERHTKSYGQVLGCELLQSYKHLQMLSLLELGLINVNAIARTDYTYTVAHWGRFMEDTRFVAFEMEKTGIRSKEEAKAIEACYLELYKQCNNSILTKEGDSVLDTLCKSGRKIQVDLFCKAKNLSPSVAQKLWLRVQSKSLNITCDDFTQVTTESSPIIDKMVYFATTTVGDLIYCDKNALVKGLHDEKINKQKCVSLEELKQMSVVKLPNGTELFHKK